jgi:Uma2 family endonuclease
MSTTATKLLTAEEFAALPDPPDGSRQELVKGVVVTMPPPKGRHGIVCSKIDRLIGNYAEAKNLGWTTSNDTGAILERDPDTVRGPDVGFWSIARQPDVPDDYFEIPPDLAVEVLSPDDRRNRVREKIREYIAAGVPLVWLVDPETRTVTVYTGRLRGTELDESDQLDGGEVVPGFSCKVGDLFPQPRS